MPEASGLVYIIDALAQQQPNDFYMQTRSSSDHLPRRSNAKSLVCYTVRSHRFLFFDSVWALLLLLLLRCVQKQGH